MTLQTFTHDQLVLSPLNVRLNEEDANATEALEASILEYGLLFPLVVHPLDDGTKRWGVLAGGRRWRAVGKLIDRHELPLGFEIEAVVREDLSPAEITELSLSENLLRRELRPYEVHAAIARAASQGASAEQIAANTGQRIEWVRQQLRLGTLAPEIFEAYAAGKLSVDQARAYGATEDHDLQRAAWKHFTGSLYHRHGAHEIRAFMKVGDRELARLLRFVTEDDYRAAGGRFELDLFADGPEHRGRVVDEGLLRQLAEDKLERIREQLRVDVQHRELRFAPEPPKYSGYTDSALEIVLEPGKPLPEGNIIATLDVDDNGKAEARFWWASRKAKADSQRGGAAAAPPAAIKSHLGGEIRTEDVIGSTGGQYEQQARTAIKDQYGLTAEGLQVMRSLRRYLLRAALVRNALAGGTLGRDYLVWSQLRQELGRDGQTQAGARGLASGYHTGDDEPPGLTKDWLGDVEARRHWEAAIEQLRREPFMEIDDPAEAFRHFVELDRDTKSLAAAILAGCALLRSIDAPGWRIPAHDALADLAGASDDQLRRFWTPDSKFAGLFPKMKRLELAEPHVGEAEFRSWHKLDDKVLTGAVAGALAHAEGWVHPLLSFGVTAEQAAAIEDDGCSVADPDCLGRNGDCHDACEPPAGGDEQDPSVNDQVEPALRVAAE